MIVPLPSVATLVLLGTWAEAHTPLLTRFRIKSVYKQRRQKNMRVTRLKSTERKQELMAFLRITAQLVDRFEQLAPDVDGNIAPADARLVKAFRIKLDELTLSLGLRSVRLFKDKR